MAKCLLAKKWGLKYLKTDLTLLNVVRARSSRGQSYKDLSSFQRKDLMLKKLWAWWFSWILSYSVLMPMFDNWSVFFLIYWQCLQTFLSLWSIFNASIFFTNFFALFNMGWRPLSRRWCMWPCRPSWWAHRRACWRTWPDLKTVW